VCRGVGFNAAGEDGRAGAVWIVAGFHPVAGMRVYGPFKTREDATMWRTDRAESASSDDFGEPACEIVWSVVFCDVPHDYIGWS